MFKNVHQSEHLSPKKHYNFVAVYIVKDGLLTDVVVHFVLIIGDLEDTIGRLIRKGVDLLQGCL